MVVPATVTASSAGSADAGTSVCQATAVPAYFAPGALWDQAIFGASPPRYMIMNPASGPGSAPDPAYGDAVARAQGAGVAVLGYVYTGYGRRPPAAVQSDISAYKQWYGVKGIFLDEASSDVADLPYYRQAAAQVRAVAGSVLALNPGTYPAEEYAQLADVLLTFEGSYADYRVASVPAWAQTYPASRFWHLVYTSTARQMSSALTLARKRSVANIYVTNDSLPNPWDTLASYWSNEVTAVASNNPAICASR